MNATGGCRTHPKYLGKRQPKSSCKVCWAIWMTENPVAQVSRNLIDAMKEVKALEITSTPVIQSGIGDEEQFVLLLSDLQVGVSTPTFGFAVFHQRMEKLLANLRKVVLLHRKAHPVNVLNVFMLGDNIQNEIIGKVVDLDHLEGTVFIQLFQHALPALERFFQELLNDFEKIKVTCVHGNHGSLGKFMANTTNFDDVAYEFLKAVFRDEPRIEFSTTLQFYNVAQIYGYKFLLVHGDKIPSTWSIPYYGITTRSMRWEGSIGQYNYLCMGHFHTYTIIDVSTRVVFINGTFLSDDEWTIKTLGWTSSVCQMLLSVHPKQGVSFVRRINLG